MVEEAISLGRFGALTMLYPESGDYESLVLNRSPFAAICNATSSGYAQVEASEAPAPGC